MKAILFSALAFAACASLAVAEPVPTEASKEDTTAAAAHSTGSVALTEAEMDKVTAGAVPAWDAAGRHVVTSNNIVILGEEKYGGWGGEW